MAGLLIELLSKVEKLESDDQLRVICDSITKEEILTPDEYEGPQGANIFLSLPLNIAKVKTEDYICLERESKGVFIISHWSRLIISAAPPKRIKVWECKQTDPAKILKEFAEKLIYLKGE